MINTKNIIEIKDLWFRYKNSEWILKNLKLAIAKGESALIIGSSGVGKTTLTRVLTGSALHIYGGEIKGYIEINGRDISYLSAEELRNIIQVINQNPYTHFIYPRIIDDLVNYAYTFCRDLSKAVNVVKEISRWLNIEGVLEKNIFEVSGGQCKKIAIAKALIPNPEILIMDEPLMWLDDNGYRELINILKMFKEMGKTIVLLEHRFLPLLSYVDSIYRFIDGNLEKIHPMDIAMLKDAENMASQIKIYEKGNISNIYGDNIDNYDVVLTNIWFRFRYSDWILKNIDIAIPKNRTVIIYGLNGSGKSTLLKVIAGYLKPQKGFIKRFGRAIYIPQNISLFFTEESIYSELKNICLRSLDRDICVEKGIELLKSYGFDDVDKTPFSLSWGQQIKLAVLLSLIGRYDILILDEPFTGLSYIDRLRLIEFLYRIPYTKIIAISNLESLALLARNCNTVYMLSNGVVKPIDIVFNKMFPDMIYKWCEAVYK